MKHCALLSVACVAALATRASADPLCDAARVELERYAQAQGLGVEVRCRTAGGPRVQVGAILQALSWPAEQLPRSGALTWPVRVSVGAARPYVRQVPLTATWSAPAWVAARALQQGAQLQSGDLLLQIRRWPEGWSVQPCDAEHPPSGRLRQALRAGDLLQPMALAPEGTLQRGDHVTAVLAEGAIEIRLPAQLMGPARVGELVRAQASGRTTALEGRLMGGQILKVGRE